MQCWMWSLSRWQAIRWNRPGPSLAGLGTAMMIWSGSLGPSDPRVWRSFLRRRLRAPFDCWRPTIAVRSDSRHPAPKGSISGRTTSSPMRVLGTRQTRTARRPLLHRQSRTLRRCTTRTERRPALSERLSRPAGPICQPQRSTRRTRRPRPAPIQPQHPLPGPPRRPNQTALPSRVQRNRRRPPPQPHRPPPPRRAPTPTSLTSHRKGPPAALARRPGAVSHHTTGPHMRPHRSIPRMRRSRRPAVAMFELRRLSRDSAGCLLEPIPTGEHLACFGSGDAER